MSRPPYASPESMARNAKKPTPAAKPPCVIGKYCEFHGWVHGAEAEELRSELEKFLKQFQSEIFEDLTEDDISGRLQKLLDEVDARDSVAFLEVKPRKPRNWEPRNERAVRARKAKK